MEHGKPISATDSPLVDFDAVCQRVRAALEPARAHAVSLHDEHGDVLWLSESSMGPDEHNAVREALDSFSSPGSPPVLVYDLGDSRSAVLLRAVNGSRAMVGAIMVVMDARVIKQNSRGALNVVTPKLQRALADFADMRPDAAPAPAAQESKAAPARAMPAKSAASSPLSLVEDEPRSTPTPDPAPSVAKPASSAPARFGATLAAPATAASAAKPAAPAAVARAAAPALPAAPAAPAQLSVPASVETAPAFGGKRTQATVTPEIDRLHAALRRSPIALHVQRLVPLIKGSQLKRYEVLLRSKSETAPNAAPQAMLKAAVENGLGSMIDRRVITELIGYLVRHPEVWKTTAVQFSVNLTTTALHDEHFIKFVELCLAKSSLPKGMIAFEIDTPTAVKLADKMAEVAAALHRLGCPLVLDDFDMKTECFALLRLPGVRYVKLAPEITAKMRTDKLSQAAITAVVQMARVLGMHTVAKRTETAAEQEWLTALGVDFVQSNSMSPPISIESLSKTANPPKPQAPSPSP
jgi:EAL domain-containing protein (putative c-di-GMP-specific phosphodiesterase class I)